MVSALAYRIRDREFESHDNHFLQNQIIILFYFIVFPFHFSQFWSKIMCDYILKIRQYWICNGKKPNFFLFFKMTNTPHNGKTIHIAWLSKGTMLLSRWRWHCTWWQIPYKTSFVVLVTFRKNDNSSCFWYTSNFNWKSSFVLIYYKSENGYPNFLFSYLLLIALYTNSTYIIWLKKIFCSILFSKFLTRYDFLFFVPSSSIPDSGTVWLDTYIKIIVICRDIHRTLRK